ncbi:hypothetical protein EDD22DRAFT_957396 [Suillus occidentalis]|nr:hypothetical protein EDD22DRAFT_957396 [Suillus occidentalis]
MSSTGPTRQALTRLINKVDTAPSQCDRRERRPSEKALYQVKEAQDREDRRQGNQAKSKVTRKRVSPHDGTQFSAHNVSLSKPLPTVPLDLRPRLSKVPPQEKQTPRQQRPPQLPTPASRQTLDRGGWREDVLTKESGFINANHARTSNSNISALALTSQSESTTPMTQRKLTAARANELIQLRKVQTAHTIFDDEDDDMGDTFEENEYDRNATLDNGQDTDLEHNNVSDNQDSCKHSGYLLSSDEEFDGPRNRKRQRTTEDFSEDSPSPQQYEPRLPCKVRKSKGRIAARDYEVAVQQLIKFAIADFRVHLASQYAYPDRMMQVSWAKEAWSNACTSHEIEIGFNGEIIQMITRCTSHLTSEVKAKLRPLVESLYGFDCSTRESVKSRNRRLVRELKEKFGLCYRDIGDKNRNVPRSGLYKTRLNQKGANLLWYQNKRDEGIMFENQFTPFPIPALALLYTAAECCIDEWTDGERSDINFASSEYKEVYDKHLTNLRKFDTQTKAHGILDSILKDINNNGRTHARVDTTDVACGDYLSDVEINNAIWESMQGGNGTNDSDCDSADEVDGESDDNGNTGEHE